MVDTLPSILTPRLKGFCTGISNGRPRFVRSKPFAGAIPHQCFNNVAKKIDRSGGTIVYGWAIWHFRGAYFEAEHHGVWKRRTGELRDVSPQLNGYRKILFLPDIDAVFDPANVRPNQIASDGDDPRATDVARIFSERVAVLQACRDRGSAMPDARAQSKADELAARGQALLVDIMTNPMPRDGTAT